TPRREGPGGAALPGGRRRRRPRGHPGGAGRGVVDGRCGVRIRGPPRPPEGPAPRVDRRVLRAARGPRGPRGPRRGPVSRHAQYGRWRYVYTEITAVTASPQPVTIRFSLLGYHTASPHANTPGTEVLMSGRTLMFRAPSSSRPHRSTFVWKGSNPTLMMIASTSFTSFTLYMLLYPTESRIPSDTSFLLCP